MWVMSLIIMIKLHNVENTGAANITIVKFVAILFVYILHTGDDQEHIVKVYTAM